MWIAKEKTIEVKYHYLNAESKLTSIRKCKTIDEAAPLLFEFRYELNSLVNTIRAVTIAMQAEHKADGKKFEDWYTKVREKLKADSFAKIIIELRNINQKEGNLYPTFEFSGLTEEVEVRFELDPMKKKSNFIGRYSVYPKPDGVITGPVANIIMDVLLDKKPANGSAMITTKYVYEQASKAMQNGTLVLTKLKVDRFQLEYEPEVFMSELARIANLLVRFVSEGEEIFLESS